MKKIINLFALLIILNSTISAQKLDTKPWNYKINIDYADSAFYFDVSLKAYQFENRKHNYFLFNRYISIEKVLIDNKPLQYTRSNDTLYFETSNKNEINLNIEYKIPCSVDESSKIIKAYSDSTFAYPIQFNKNHFFFERYNKFFPVLYDNFSNYEVKISVPKTYKILGEYQENNIVISENRARYSFKFFDEDFRFFITKSDIFQTTKKLYSDKTYFEFSFLPKKKRLLSFINKTPKYATDINQMDSLYDVIVNRSIEAFKWYNKNLWEQKVDTFSFVEAGIFGVALNMRRFILFDRMLMNMEAIDQSWFAHEIGHLWVGYNIEYSSKGFYFLSETINEFNNLLYLKSWSGEAEFENAIKNKINMHYSDKPFYTVSFEKVLYNDSGILKSELNYSKGVAFVYEFYKMIGEEKYFGIIKDTYMNPKKYLTLKDFENSIKKNECWDEYMKLFKLEL